MNLHRFLLIHPSFRFPTRQFILPLAATLISRVERRLQYVIGFCIFLMKGRSLSKSAALNTNVTTKLSVTSGFRENKSLNSQKRAFGTF